MTGLATNWGISFRRTREDLCIAGSPNRTLKRTLWEDTDGQVYILEEYDLRKKAAQTAQNRMLEFFRSQGLPGIFPARQTLSGEQGVIQDRKFLQLRPWIEADPLDRKTLGEDSRTALLWGDFLLQLQQISRQPGLPELCGERFFFSDYIPRLTAFTRRNMPELHTGLQAVLRRMRPYLEREKSQPAMLAHGDFHPGNILLKENRIAGVIDWEFLGWKSAGYDLALLLGCLGMDDPDWLDGSAVHALQDHLFLRDYMPESSWQDLPLLMAAIRLGWLGEWVDLAEKELAHRELDYIHFLLG